MQSGRLRNRCVLQEQKRVPDGAGGHSEEWVKIGEVWTEITMPTGRVATVANQLEALISAEIRARPRASLVAGRRLVYPKVTYLIEAALSDNDHSMLRLLCSSVKT